MTEPKILASKDYKSIVFAAAFLERGFEHQTWNTVVQPPCHTALLLQEYLKSGNSTLSQASIPEEDTTVN
jgi:hypothetical protein